MAANEVEADSDTGLGMQSRSERIDLSTIPYPRPKMSPDELAKGS